MCISTGTYEASIETAAPIATIARLCLLERVAICAATSTTTTADRTHLAVVPAAQCCCGATWQFHRSNPVV
jgi:hypothetical protein